MYFMPDELTVFLDVAAPRGTQKERWSSEQAPDECNCKKVSDIS
jgi:hypothetical protein